uniref:Uncharacterized protein n=1 Tax=Physcomitrium patens TaxID=3218 RepID=A0A2K1I9L2_PHYPA|nr:hypothetical protein PHYPA_031264 [Physcomitrium patens]
MVILPTKQWYVPPHFGLGILLILVDKDYLEEDMRRVLCCLLLIDYTSDFLLRCHHLRDHIHIRRIDFCVSLVHIRYWREEVSRHLPLRFLLLLGHRWVMLCHRQGILCCHHVEMV